MANVHLFMRPALCTLKDELREFILKKCSVKGCCDYKIATSEMCSYHTRRLIT